MRSFFFVLALLLNLLPVAIALRGSRCLVLALEGGGTKGAYQAGAFDALVKLLDPGEVKYDVISGVSVGILNGLMIASHQLGEEKEASRKLTELWQNITSDKLFVQWPFPGPLQGLLNKPSFFDNSPELELVTKVFQDNGGQLHRGMSIGVVDAQTGKFLTVNQDTEAKKIPFYVVASSSVPGFFKHQAEAERVYIDGFTVDNLNLRGGIEECQKLVSDNSKIIVDVIFTKPFDFPKWNATEHGAYDIYRRATDLGKLSSSWFYFLDVLKAFPKVRLRYLIKPKEQLPNYPFVPLSFDKELLKKEWRLGYQDAVEVVKAPSSVEAELRSLRFTKTLRRRISQ